MKLLQTPLYQECKELGGKMVPFANWEMPVSFSGLIEEHNAVRKKVMNLDNRAPSKQELDEMKKDINDRKIPLKQILKDEAIKAFNLWTQTENKTKY